MKSRRNNPSLNLRFHNNRSKREDAAGSAIQHPAAIQRTPFVDMVFFAGSVQFGWSETPCLLAVNSAGGC